MELAGSVWFTTEKVIAGWNEVKDAVAADSADAISHAIWAWGDVLPEWMGARFTKSKKLRDAFPMQPTNAVTLVEKLNKISDYELLDAYEWLCNVAHPSLGGTMLYSATRMEGPLDTYGVTYTSDRLVRTSESDSAQSEAGDVRKAITGGGMAAFDSLVIAVRHAEMVVDDICLTAEIANRTVFNHYRLHQTPDRNQVCPCGSGQKAKRCDHSWGATAKRLPDRLVDPVELDSMYVRAEAMRANLFRL
jgi:hypothetical protein